MNFRSYTEIGHFVPSKLAGQGNRSKNPRSRNGANCRNRQAFVQKPAALDRQTKDPINQVELMQVPGIDEANCSLLRAAGVATARELAYRNPYNLHSALQVVNEHEDLMHRNPSLNEVVSWVRAAIKLTLS